MTAPQAPTLPARSARVDQIVATAADLLETGGPDAVSMRAVAEGLGIKAPSLYKHVRDKADLEALLVADGLVAMGTVLHEAIAPAAPGHPVPRLLRAYRARARAAPAIYRLATGGTLDRSRLPEGLEDWAGQPFWLATGQRPYRAQALWGATHGMTILELDGRFADTSDLDRSWRELAAAFTD